MKFAYKTIQCTSWNLQRKNLIKFNVIIITFIVIIKLLLLFLREKKVFNTNYIYFYFLNIIKD